MSRMANLGIERRYVVGAEIISTSETSFRVWAPERSRVELVLPSRTIDMTPEQDGYWALTSEAAHGTRYGFRLDGGETLADPASRWQPDGVMGLSAVWDPGRHIWHDHDWEGTSLADQVLYEMHLGTFTPEGTWAGAMSQLLRLKSLGVTTLQVMPIGAFAGRFGWGYDGVFWMAPHAAYGSPHDIRTFVDRAHSVGLAVILDMVFNHLGPSGNVLPRFSPHYLSRRYDNEWGDALNYDGPSSHGLRDLVLSTIEYWIREFHVDGYRLDATQQIMDDSPTHILADISRQAREAAFPRSIILVAEHEPQHAQLIRPRDKGGYGLDAIFNEDLHHSFAVALTGMRDAYLSDYAGTAREWFAAFRGPLYQGQQYPWQSNPRGAPALDHEPRQFVAFLENHDQVANLSGGRRLRDLTSPAWWRTLSALLLLGPWTPLLFQGQEWGSRRRFLYFTDHEPDLQLAVRRGRRGFLSQFTRSDDVAGSSDVGMDIGEAAYSESWLDHPYRVDTVAEWRLYRDLLALRARLNLRAGSPLASTLADNVFVVRYRATDAEPERLLVVNLGPDLSVESQPEPLLGLDRERMWTPEWCSEHPDYGGSGMARGRTPHAIVATGHAASLFAARPRT